MAWFEKGNDELHERVHNVMEKHHPELHAAGVSITVLVARSSGDSATPALMVRGREALGMVRITSLRDRTLGIDDAVITLNGDHFFEHLRGKADAKELDAVIDHELQHLTLAIDKKTGQVKEDDMSRPMLKIRPHDFEFGWFSAVATRWGSASAEVQQARELMQLADWVQPLLPGFKVDAAEVASVMVERKKKRTAAAG